MFRRFPCTFFGMFHQFDNPWPIISLHYNKHGIVGSCKNRCNCKNRQSTKRYRSKNRQKTKQNNQFVHQFSLACCLCYFMPRMFSVIKTVRIISPHLPFPLLDLKNSVQSFFHGVCLEPFFSIVYMIVHQKIDNSAHKKTNYQMVRYRSKCNRPCKTPSTSRIPVHNHKSSRKKQRKQRQQIHFLCHKITRNSLWFN